MYGKELVGKLTTLSGTGIVENEITAQLEIVNERLCATCLQALGS